CSSDLGCLVWTVFSTNHSFDSANQHKVLIGTSCTDAQPFSGDRYLSSGIAVSHIMDMLHGQSLASRNWDVAFVAGSSADRAITT
ncbi:MAG: hypothetical protein ACEQSD_12325, partial [Flavobacteriales bacterium]